MCLIMAESRCFCELFARIHPIRLTVYFKRQPVSGTLVFHFDRMRLLELPCN